LNDIADGLEEQSTDEVQRGLRKIPTRDFPVVEMIDMTTTATNITDVVEEAGVTATLDVEEERARQSSFEKKLSAHTRHETPIMDTVLREMYSESVTSGSPRSKLSMDDIELIAEDFCQIIDG